MCLCLSKVSYISCSCIMSLYTLYRVLLDLCQWILYHLSKYISDEFILCIISVMMHVNILIGLWCCCETRSECSWAAGRPSSCSICTEVVWDVHRLCCSQSAGCWCTADARTWLWTLSCLPSRLMVSLKCFITVRCSALHGLCDHNSVRPSVRLSVCPSVHLSHSWTVSTWIDLRLWFLHHMVAPSF